MYLRTQRGVWLRRVRVQRWTQKVVFRSARLDEGRRGHLDRGYEQVWVLVGESGFLRSARYNTDSVSSNVFRSFMIIRFKGHNCARNSSGWETNP